MTDQCTKWPILYGERVSWCLPAIGILSMHLAFKFPDTGFSDKYLQSRIFGKFPGWRGRREQVAGIPVSEVLRVNSSPSSMANVEFYAPTGLRCGVWHILTKSNRLFRVEVPRLISRKCQPPGADARLNSLSIQMAGRLPTS